MAFPGSLLTGRGWILGAAVRAVGTPAKVPPMKQPTTLPVRRPYHGQENPEKSSSSHPKSRSASRFEPIDQEPLSGRARSEFESELYKKVKRGRQLVLRVILGFAGGRADCWVGNARIGEIAGYQIRNVQIILRQLEADGLIKCLYDHKVKTQRRIVILDHPNAVRVLAKLGALPREFQPKGAQEAPSKPSPVPAQRAQKAPEPRAQTHGPERAQTPPVNFSGSNAKEMKSGFSFAWKKEPERARPRSREEQIRWLERRIAEREATQAAP